MARLQGYAACVLFVALGLAFVWFVFDTGAPRFEAVASGPDAGWMP